jgi:aspartyl protease family protein
MKAGENFDTMLFWPIMIVGVVVLALLLAQPAPDVVTVGEYIDLRTIALLLLTAALVITSAGRLLLLGGRKTILQSVAWVGAIAGFATAFVYRDEAALVIDVVHDEITAYLAPESIEPGARIVRAPDGHYLADAEVNGTPISLLVDTGASMVLIPFEQAAAIGIDTGRLDFSLPVTTANGSALVAPVRLSSIKVQRVAVFDVAAAVAQPGRLKTGLLGMSFLEKLPGSSFQGDYLFLQRRVPVIENETNGAVRN